jgi:hypothetical protein
MLNTMPRPEPSALGSGLYTLENSGPVELLPNPDFVFPARAPEPASPTQQTPAWSSLNQRRATKNLSVTLSPPSLAARPHTSATLPDFTFGAPSPSNDSPRSPHSPFGQPPTPKTARHRRGGSEFIVGDRTTGSINIIGASPGMPVPSASQPTLHIGPPPGRRHAHKRSGAISCHDLNSILSQPRDGFSQSKAGSAPTSPLDIENKPTFLPFHGAENTNPVPPVPGPTEPAKAEEPEQKRPVSRARVGFCDRVEYIRPLSIISSETESSMSTIKGHSVTGSWSSVISATSPQRHRASFQSTLDEDAVLRPQTAEPLTLPPAQNARPSMDSPEERPKSASCSTDSGAAESRSKKRGFPWFDSKVLKSPVPEAAKAVSVTSDQSSPPDSPSSRRSLESEGESLGTASNPPARKPRRVRSWAHSLMSRKQKSKKDQARPASPPSDVAQSDSASPEMPQFDLDLAFDVENTVTIIDEAEEQPASPTFGLTPLRTDMSRVDADVLSPIIDLDAALGPFNTPLLNSNIRDLPKPRARRSLHSLSGASYSTPGHRRTESAPELLPFELRNSKLAQPPVMPDVFEEEDEEAELASETASPEPETFVPSDAPAEALPSVSSFATSRTRKCDRLVISTDDQPIARRRPNMDMGSVEVVEHHEDVRASKSSDDTVTPTTEEKERPMAMSLRSPIMNAPSQVMTPDTLSDMSTSPFFNPSQVSLDAPRLGTGTSSLNDYRPFSFGEPGPEVRISVDDVPSLTSSRSTMTSPVHQPNLRPFSSGRAPSVYSTRSTATANMERKRGSIASLSRLVTGGFGERSKLFIESRPVSQHTMEEDKARKGRRHRLSKLIQFWKGREAKPKKGDVHGE